MTNKEKLYNLKEYLDTLYPNTKCFLNHQNDYQLLFAVIMSAQSQDRVVNSVTPTLFTKYPSLESLANADLNSVIDIIKIVGLAPTKAKNIIKSAQILIERFNGIVPKDIQLSVLSIVDNPKQVANDMEKAAELPKLPVMTDTNVENVDE